MMSESSRIINTSEPLQSTNEQIEKFALLSGCQTVAAFCTVMQKKAPCLTIPREVGAKFCNMLKAMPNEEPSFCGYPATKSRDELALSEAMQNRVQKNRQGLFQGGFTDIAVRS